MRASEVRATLAEAIEAIEPDSKAQGRDRFVHLEGAGRDVDRAGERAFVLSLSAQPEPQDLMSCSAYEVEYQLTRFYVASPGVEDRIASDTERLQVALWSLHRISPDIHTASLTPLGMGEETNQITVTDSVLVSYRLDSDVAA